MEPWTTERVVLREGPTRRQGTDSTSSAAPQVEHSSESQLFEYRETPVAEYDGIQVYLQEGSYEHDHKTHQWSFYEYRMWVNNECWNIVMNVDLNKPPDWNYAGSNSAKLSHDFCHLNTDHSDEVYTHFSFVEMGGRPIWPFYTGEDYQEDLWIWVSPRRWVGGWGPRYLVFKRERGLARVPRLLSEGNGLPPVDLSTWNHERTWLRHTP